MNKESWWKLGGRRRRNKPAKPAAHRDQEKSAPPNDKTKCPKKEF